MRSPASDVRKAEGFDVGPYPGVILDETGRLETVNDAAETLFGQGLVILRRGAFLDHLAPDCELRALVERARREAAPIRARDVELAFADAASVRVDAAAAPLAGGGLLLTLRSRAEDAPHAADDIPGMRSVIGMGQMLAHEIKNPLAGIRGAAQLLKAGVSVADAPLAELIVEETDRIRRLVDQLETFSDRPPPRPAPVNIHRVLDRVRALVANGVGEGLPITTDFDPSLPGTLGDADALTQLFLNLAKNAAEAARARDDGRGEIGLATACRRGPRSSTGVGGGEGMTLEVRVTDNGPGVAADLRDRLFEPFVGDKAGGAGLGLAVAARILAVHGGGIELESRPGRTTFKVRLPLATSYPLEEVRP